MTYYLLMKEGKVLAQDSRLNKYIFKMLEGQKLIDVLIQPEISEIIDENYLKKLNFANLTPEMIIKLLSIPKYEKIILEIYNILSPITKYTLLTQYPEKFIYVADWNILSTDQKLELIRNPKIINQLNNMQPLDLKKIILANKGRVNEYILENKNIYTNMINQNFENLVSHSTSNIIYKISNKEIYSLQSTNLKMKSVLNNLEDNYKYDIYTSNYTDLKNIIKNNCTFTSPEIILKLLNQKEYITFKSINQLLSMFKKLSYEQILDALTNSILLDKIKTNNIFYLGCLEKLNNKEKMTFFYKYPDLFKFMPSEDVTNLLTGFTEEEIKQFFNNQEFKQKIIESIQSYQGNSNEIIKIIFDNYIPNIMKLYSADLAKTEKYYDMFKLLNNNIELRNKIFNDEFLQKVDKLSIEFPLIIKYQSKNNNLASFINAIDTDIDKYNKTYTYLKQLIHDNDSLGTTFAVNLAGSIIRYKELYEEINELGLNQEEAAILSKLIQDKNTYDIKSKDDLLKYEEIKNEKIKYLINDVNTPSYELKNEILLNLCGITFEDFQTMLSQEININTLEKISKKELSNSDLQKVLTLKLFLDTINKTINSTTNKEDLKEMLKLFDTQEKRSEYSSIISYFSNIHEKIRSIYEIDANISLTNLENLTDEQKEDITKKVSINNEEIKYYDLSTYEHGIYVHAAFLNNLDGLINPYYIGNSFICVTPISDQGKKGFYDNNTKILYGYTHIPEGGFIASSTCNTGSNHLFQQNTTQLNDKSKYYQFEFKDSSSIKEFGGSSHSETNIIRDRFIPSCIVMKGDIPTNDELEAQKKLSSILKKEIPLIKTQPIGMTIENPKKLEYKTEEKNITLDESTLKNFDELKGEIYKLRDSLIPHVSPNQISEITNVRHATGASHNIYSCKINNEKYLLKPGTDKSMQSLEPWRVYAVLTGYNIQKLINPETAVEIRPIKASIGKNEEEILSSAVKLIPNTKDFEYLDNNTYPQNGYEALPKEKVEDLLREFIVDHLIFNTDTKGANFIYDSNHIYGIDKEQALKFLSNPNLNDTKLSYLRHTGNGCQTMYANLFEAYIDGKQPISEESFNVLYQICDQLDALSDEEYLKNFEDYIGCSNAPEETKNYIRNIILSRKKSLRDEMDLFMTEINNKKLNKNGGTYAR